MAEKIDNLSGDERAQRIAALKAKMQASAQQRQEDTVAEGESETADKSASAEPVVTEEPTAEAGGEETAAEETASEDAEAGEADAEAPATNGAAAAPTTAPATATNGNSATAVPPSAATAPTIEGVVEEEEDEEAAERRYYNRREFMVYTLGFASLLALGESGYAIYEFMYPRFRAGEFGGIFFVEESAVPSADASPEAYTDGKFWLVQTEEGDPKALYMVCTHLGCLYKWEPSNFRFECPCHGSKFTHDGLYIEGPAPRSLDSFEILADGDGQLGVDTGSRIAGAPAIESPARQALA